MTRVSVKVGDFRNRLSAYLKKVRNGGEVVIKDRDNPIGIVIPYRNEPRNEPFDFITPPKNPEGLAKLSFFRAKCTVDVVDFLLEDRRGEPDRALHKS